MGQRRRARELALQIMFQREYVPEVPLDARIEYFVKHMAADEDTAKYASFLTHGIEEHQKELDEKISAGAQNWSLSRMALVDRNILRIACFEVLKAEEVPPKVAINEAVELAKRYGGSESSGFINGILDELLKGVS